MEGLTILPFAEELHNINLTGEITEEMLKNLTDKINEIRASDNDVALNNFSVLQSIGINVSVGLPPIYIKLSSCGGSVYVAMAIYDLIKDLQRAYTVNIISNGYCMSAGCTVLLSVPKQNRFCYQHTTFLLHTLSSGGYGKLKDLEENVEEWKRLHEIMWGIYKDETKIPKKVLDDIYREKQDLFLDAKKAKSWGLVGQIL